MTITDRQVRTLRIRASSDERAHHAAVVLEDALRTATIPDTSGARVVLIRQLDVGMITGAASVTGLAFAVEVAATRLLASATHGASPNAGTAPAVYFRDDTDALVALARRLARGNTSAEWFWPLIVRGWSAIDRPEHLAALLLDRAFAGAASVPAAGVAAAAQVVATFVAMGAGALVLAPLTVERGVALLGASGWSGMREAASFESMPSSSVPSMPPTTRALIAQWMAQWGGPRDPRTVWLAWMLLVAERPGRATSVGLPGIVRVLLASIVEESSESGTNRGGSGVSGTASAGPSDRDDLVVDAREGWESEGDWGVDSETGGAPSRITRPSAPLSPPSKPSAPTDDVYAPSLGDPWSHAPRRTLHAGLVFLVPLLTRLGIEELLAERTDLAELDWSDGLLLRLAYRLGVPTDDAALTWLRADGLPVAPANRAVTATWMRATRARARRDTGRTLAAIVRRTGVIAATHTHIDVFLRHTEVDVAVRRAGLDIDPGWVPWLGKVIQFHYGDAIPDGIS